MFITRICFYNAVHRKHYHSKVILGKDNLMTIIYNSGVIISDYNFLFKQKLVFEVGFLNYATTRQSITFV